jgi:hypothetical protein
MSDGLPGRPYVREARPDPQKPVRREYEQNPEAVRNWLEEEYPAIRDLAPGATVSVGAARIERNRRTE